MFSFKPFLASLFLPFTLARFSTHICLVTTFLVSSFFLFLLSRFSPSLFHQPINFPLLSSFLCCFLSGTSLFLPISLLKITIFFSPEFLSSLSSTLFFFSNSFFAFFPHYFCFSPSFSSHLLYSSLSNIYSFFLFISLLILSILHFVNASSNFCLLISFASGSLFFVGRFFTVSTYFFYQPVSFLQPSHSFSFVFLGLFHFILVSLLIFH
jgi:hypothetical protein